jgi:hypothetical protein
MDINHIIGLSRRNETPGAARDAGPGQVLELGAADASYVTFAQPLEGVSLISRATTARFPVHPR